MSEAIAFDSHKFAKRLTDHGFSAQQAQILASEQVDLLNSNLAAKADFEARRLATKADIEARRRAAKAKIAGFQREIEGLRRTAKTDIEHLQHVAKAAISTAKFDLLKWVFYAVMVQGGLFIALAKLLE